MRSVLHLGKVFGIAWVVITALYFGIVMLWGAGVGIYWRGSTRPSKLELDLILFGWPVVAALLVALFWESARFFGKVLRSKVS